jgi:hypothetical protein
LDQQTIVNNWYDEYREKNNIPQDQPVSATDLVYFIALEKESLQVPAWKVNVVIIYIIKKLRMINDDMDQKTFVEIFGSDDLFYLFSREFHFNMLKFLSVQDSEYTEKFVNYIQKSIIKKLNA